MDILLTIIIVLAYYLSTKDIKKYKDKMNKTYKELKRISNIHEIEINNLKKDIERLKNE